MKREILFRGKGCNGKTWVEGLPHIARYTNNLQIQTLNKNYYEVVPETVGQYTGLTDKNGKKIFEGDILESHYDELYPDDFSYEVVLWSDNSWCIKEENSAPDRLDEDGVLEYSAVAGNIHDDPELLK